MKTKKSETKQQLTTGAPRLFFADGEEWVMSEHLTRAMACFREIEDAVDLSRGELLEYILSSFLDQWRYEDGIGKMSELEYSIVSGFDWTAAERKVAKTNIRALQTQWREQDAMEAHAEL